MWPIAQWWTGVMGYIGSGAYGAIVYRGYGIQEGIGHMGIGGTGVIITGGIEYKGYGPHGQWDT